MENTPTRWVVVLACAFAVMVAAPREAEARRGVGIVVINTGDDIAHLGDLAPDVAAATGYTKHGYHYQRFGLFWIDFWRWGGEPAVYEGSTYVPLTPELAAELGVPLPTPWSYHFPPGLLLVIVGAELALVARKPRTVRVTMIAAGGLVGFAALLWFKHAGMASIIPALASLYHVAAIWLRPYDAQAEETWDADADDTPASAPKRTGYATGTAPRVETDPFRANPQPPPVVVERPSQPAVIPVAHDPRAAAPKLLG